MNYEKFSKIMAVIAVLLPFVGVVLVALLMWSKVEVRATGGWSSGYLSRLTIRKHKVFGFRTYEYNRWHPTFDKYL